MASAAPGAPAPPPSRNAACPCGSGRRWKDCHGALAAPAARDPRLDAALSEQRAGRLDAARAGYAAVLADRPDDFDALHMLGVVDFQRGEFERALAPLERAVALRPGEAAARHNLALARLAIDRRGAAAELDRLAAREPPPAAADADDDDLRVIAFYLPQYHRIPENDRWWGEGFTEWTNVRRARPRFDGHRQPLVPGELGYYDLTDAAAREAQAALARAHGVDAFCYYHYWFGGRRLLERPFTEVLASGRPDFPFCLCWANEPWSRRWDGRDEDVLMPQRYAPGDLEAFIDELIPVFRDRRYLRVGGRPLLAVYRPDDLPDPAAAVALWRARCRAAGVGDPYLAGVQARALDDPARHGFDAAIEFPPIGHAAENITASMPGLAPSFRGRVFDYANLAADYLLRPRPASTLFRGVTPMWDNTARRPDDGMVLHGATPARFAAWTRRAAAQTRLRRRGDERLLFVNAWNEWAEGCHLEPDAADGRAWLHALRSARRPTEGLRPVRPSLDAVRARAVADASVVVERIARTPPAGAAPVSVVVPLYEHARYVERALDSVARQSRAPAELVVVDDGSRDDGVERVRAFARSAPFAVTIARQANAGAPTAINRGLALASQPVLAILNSDDAWAPARLERVLPRLDDAHALAYTDVELLDDDDAPARSDYARALRDRLDDAAREPDLLRVLVRHNPAVSTGNLVFRRDLVDRAGGFAELPVCHDWDFLLAATRHTRVARVAERLYRYRMHAGNTYAGGVTLGGSWDGERLLDDFFAGLATHPALAGDGALDRFVAFAREAGLACYLPADLAAGAELRA